MKRLDGSEIWDCGRFPPEALRRKVREPGTGKVRLEQVPPGKFERWVDQAGNVRPVRMTTSAALHLDRDYESYTRGMWRAAGGIPFGRCPLRDPEGSYRERDFPEELHRACDDQDEFGRPRFGNHGCCKHVDFIIAERRAEWRKAHEARERNRRKKERREEEMLAETKKQNEALRDILAKQVE